MKKIERLNSKGTISICHIPEDSCLCPGCLGSGIVDYDGRGEKICPKCDGRGYVNSAEQESFFDNLASVIGQNMVTEFKKTILGYEEKFINT